MSKVWIIVADDMSAAKVAGVAASTNEEVEAVVLGSRERAEHVATLGVSTVFGMTQQIRWQNLMREPSLMRPWRQK